MIYGNKTKITDDLPTDVTKFTYLYCIMSNVYTESRVIKAEGLFCAYPSVLLITILSQKQRASDRRLWWSFVSHVTYIPFIKLSVHLKLYSVYLKDTTLKNR